MEYFKETLIDIVSQKYIFRKVHNKGYGYIRMFYKFINYLFQMDHFKQQKMKMNCNVFQKQQRNSVDGFLMKLDKNIKKENLLQATTKK